MAAFLRQNRLHQGYASGSLWTPSQWQAMSDRLDSSSLATPAGTRKSRLRPWDQRSLTAEELTSS